MPVDANYIHRPDDASHDLIHRHAFAIERAIKYRLYCDATPHMSFSDYQDDFQLDRGRFFKSYE